MKNGRLDRWVLWETPAGKVVSIRSRRLVSFPERHLAQMMLDARGGRVSPWLDLARVVHAARADGDDVGPPRLKGENVMYHDGWLYVTTGDGYRYQRGAHGAVYRARVDEP